MYILWYKQSFCQYAREYLGYVTRLTSQVNPKFSQWVGQLKFSFKTYVDTLSLRIKFFLAVGCIARYFYFSFVDLVNLSSGNNSSIDDHLTVKELTVYYIVRSDRPGMSSSDSPASMLQNAAQSESSDLIPNLRCFCFPGEAEKGDGADSVTLLLMPASYRDLKRMYSSGGASGRLEHLHIITSSAFSALSLRE